MSRRIIVCVLVLSMAAGLGFLAAGCGSKAKPAKPVDMVFQCKSTNNTFTLTGAEMEDRDTYIKYFGRAAEDVECRVCQQADALWVYYCPQCKLYYKYRPKDVGIDDLQCIKKHEIPPENR